MIIQGLDSAQSAFFLKQLQHRKAKLLEAPFPPFKMLQKLPISREAPPGADTITQYTYTPIGMAAIVASYGDDIPAVDVVASEVVVKVREMADHFTDSLTEIENASMANLPLSQKKMNALVRGLDQKKNSIALNGDAKHGLYGVLTFPNFNKFAAPTGAWTMQSDPDDILADVAELIGYSFTHSNGVEDLTQNKGTVMFPHSYWQILLRKKYSPEGKTLMSFLVDTYKGVDFGYAAELDAVAINPRTGAVSTTKVCLAFQADPDKVSLEVPLEFDVLPPQYVNLHIKTIGRAKTAGVMSSFPVSFSVMDG